MGEELLKAIIQLFAIVAKERITEDERANIQEFLGVDLNQESTKYYLQLFHDYCCNNKVERKDELENIDDSVGQCLPGSLDPA